MSNSIAPGSSADINVKVTALTTNPNVPVTYKTIILKKNLVNGVNTLTQEMMSTTNTKYVIKYDYVLGEDITVPAGCILEFDGGSISANDNNDTITGANTGINAGLVKIFNTNVTLAGSWNVEYISDIWFDNQVNDIKNAFALLNENIYNRLIISKNHVVRAIQNSDYILNVKSNTDLILKGNISLEANNYTHYAILAIQNASNVNIIGGGGTITGDLDTHTGSEGEWGMGVQVRNNCSFVTIKNLEISKCWGDGIIVGGEYGDDTIYIENCHIHHCRRQGISLTYVENVTIENCKIHDISGTSPSACIDCEPSASINQVVDNIFIKNCELYNSNYGILLTVDNENYNLLSNINISKCNIYNNITWQLICFCSLNTSISNCNINGTNCIRTNKAKGVTFVNTFIQGKIISFNRDYNNLEYKLDFKSCTIVSTGAYENDTYDSVIKRAEIKNSKIKGFYYLENIDSIGNTWTLDKVGDGAYAAPWDGVRSFGDNIVYACEDIQAYAIFQASYCVFNEVNISKASNNIIVPGGLIYSKRTNFFKGKFDEAFRSIVINRNTSYLSSIHIYPEENETKRGTTSERPTTLGSTIDIGFQYFDTTLNKPIYWTGSSWVDSTGATV